MEIWCDSAQSEIVATYANQGWMTGVTTNPKILSSQTRPAAEQIAQLLEVQLGPVAVQVTAEDEQGMLAQAKKLHAFSLRLIIKIPMTRSGIKVLPYLKSMGIPTLATAVYSATQFLLAAKIGVEYVAPYLHQMQSNGIDAFEEVTIMQKMIQHYGYETKVMAASIQDFNLVKKIASLGVASVTLTPACLAAWIENPLTQEGTKTLNEAWAPFAKEYAGMLFNE